jgi:Spy/CpxP family protein refolding chaperone
MRQFLAIGILSVLVFAGGYGVRIWVDDHRPLPVPPGPLMGEFAPKPAAPAAAGAPKPLNRADLAAKVEQYRTQMETYRNRIAEIDAEFEHNLQSVFTPEQNAHHAARLARAASKAAHPPGPEDSQPLTDEEITGLLQRPLWGVFNKIALQVKIDDLNKELKLDAGQQDKVRELLRHRRDEFLVLVDSVPPPSLLYLGLAPAAQRLGAPKSDAYSSPKP